VVFSIAASAMAKQLLLMALLCITLSSLSAIAEKNIFSLAPFTPPRIAERVPLHEGVPRLLARGLLMCFQKLFPAVHCR
jgi:hypothetical protein